MKEIDSIMDALIENDANFYNKLLNEITLGLYDFPNTDSDQEKIKFIGNKLKHFAIEDLVKYSRIMNYNLDRQTAETVILKMIEKDILGITEKTINQQKILYYYLKENELFNR